ncbi:MAG: PAS domain-containing sensor histidine kinase [Henriciella sp.]
MQNGVVKQIRQFGGLWFQGLFLLAAIICATASFIALARTSPTAAVPAEVQILLVLNTIVLMILGWIVVARYLDLRAAARADGGGLLARRFMLLFGMSAIIPSVIVSLFLWATIENGIETWFGQRVVTLVEESSALADEYVSDFSDNFEQDARLMAADVNNAAEGYANDRARFESYLGIQSYIRNIPSAYIVDSEGLPTATAENMVETGFFRRMSPQILADADAGEVVLELQEQAGFAFALIKLEDIPGTYLYLAKAIDTNLVSQLRSAQDAFADYRLAEERSEQLQFLFLIAYFQIVALILLLSVRLAQEVAGRISRPISRLAYAAQEVSEGVRGVHVPLPDSEDEVRALSQSFNLMTSQLDDRRSELISAREDAETRRQFLETLLAELSAGVVRINETGTVTLANRSAESLLSTQDLTGRPLFELSPELTRMVRQTIDTGEPVDASLNLEDESEGPRHIRLKVTPDASDGYVLTFDDATRLVNAQRQLAWRDVARRIAHEIRNPLTPILLSTERLKRRYSGKIDDPDGVFARCVDTITRQVNDIGRMVQEFSDFARMPKPTPVVFDLVALLEDICFSQRVVNPDYDIVLHAEDNKIEVMGDDRLLGQAFGNIVKNAAEALTSRPPTDETIGQIQVHLSALDNTHVELVFSDNGPGFPEDVREQLLEPYVSAKEGGTGLGLAIVNRVIMDHGGTINLQDRSDDQRGASVRVVLPVSLAGVEGLKHESVEFVE